MKRLLVGLLILLALVAAGATLRVRISSEAVVRRMAAALVPATDERRVTVGQAEIRFLPRLAIQFSDVAIASADGAARLTAPRVRADLEVLPLFVGRTAISRLVLETPHLEVTTSFSRDGFLPERRLMAAMPPVSVIVHKGTVRLADRDGSAVETLSAVEANLRWPRALGNLSLDASATWRGDPVTLLVQGLSPPRLASGDTGDLDVNVRLPGLDAGFSGKALLSDRLMLDGRLTVASDDPCRTARYLHLATGAGRAQIPALPPTSFDGRLRTQGWLASLNDAHLRIGSAAADGFLSLQVDTPRPQLRGTLAFGNIEIGSGAEPASNADWLDWTPDLAGLADLDLDLRFSVVRARIAGVPAANMAASLLVSNGQIHADVGDAQIFGGNGSVILRGGVDGTDLSVNGRFGLTAASIASLRTIEPLEIVPQVGGLLNLAADFHARGRSLRTLRAALTGKAVIDGPQASLEHLTTPALVVAASGSGVAHAIASRLIVAPLVNRIAGTIGFAGPDLTVEALALQLGDAEVDLAGAASLAGRAVTLAGALRLPQRAVVDGAAIDASPSVADVSLSGTLDAATMTIRDRVPPRP